MYVETRSIKSTLTVSEGTQDPKTKLVIFSDSSCPHDAMNHEKSSNSFPWLPNVVTSGLEA